MQKVTPRQRIADRLRLAREESGLTLRDVEAALPVGELSHVTVMNYERGLYPPTLEAMLLLADVYERDLMWFLATE
jgi:transcriptional regulator with XRE-family HTH domain